jgi:hypothetical protein
LYPLARFGAKRTSAGMFPGAISRGNGAFVGIRRGLAAAGAAVYHCKLKL